MPVITAFRPGHCFMCNKPIHRGQRITVHYATKEWVHLPCMLKDAEQTRGVRQQ